jgi:flagellar biosynthesis chaperone FliJ
LDTPQKYPLDQLKQIKKNRFDQAVKILEEKKTILQKAVIKLNELKLARDEVLKHKIDKIDQLRTELDAGTTSLKIQQMKDYLKTVDERLQERERKVTEQQKHVDAAEKQVELATKELFQRKKDLEKLEMHKVEWEKEARYLSEQKEAAVHDEQGSAGHIVRKKEKEYRERHEKD